MVFVFNTSFYIAQAKLGQWEQWLSSHLLPAVNRAMPEISAEVFEVVSVSNAGNHVYSVQWRCHSITQTEALDSCLAEVLNGVPLLFGEEVTHFSSIMKKCDE